METESCPEKTSDQEGPCQEEPSRREPFLEEPSRREVEGAYKACKNQASSCSS